MRLRRLTVPAACAGIAVLVGCSSSTGPKDSPCSKFYFNNDSTELWYSGFRVIANGVLSSTVTSDDGLSIQTTVTRRDAPFGRPISGYTAVVNGTTCRWP